MIRENRVNLSCLSSTNNPFVILAGIVDRKTPFELECECIALLSLQRSFVVFCLYDQDAGQALP